MFQITVPMMKDIIKYVVVDMNEPCFFWGQPGGGKTQGSDQAANEIGALACDVRLSQYDSVDLRGFPGLDEATGTTVWHAPSTLPFNGNPRFPEDRLTLLILDEANAASPAVSAVAYQLVNERRVGEHELHDNVRVVMMGNREGDRGVTNKQPLPLANRLIHYEVIPELMATCEHFQRIGVPAVFVAFLQYRQELLSTFDPSKPEKAFATPRTWEKAAKAYSHAMPEDLKMATMAGAVGDGPAAEFWGFVDVWKNIVPIRKILADPTGVEMPDEVSMRYATCINVSGHMAPDNIDKLHAFVRRMDPIFTVLAWKLAIKRDEKLEQTREFVDFAREFNSLFR